MRTHIASYGDIPIPLRSLLSLLLPVLGLSLASILFVEEMLRSVV